MTTSLIRFANSAPAAPAPPANGATPPQPSNPDDRFSWSGALALPAYTFGAGAGAVSSLVGFAERFPPGGITINPGQGIVRNPEWTRNFTEGSLANNLQPILAITSAAVFLARGACELSEGLKTGDQRLQTAAALDIALAITSATQLVNPGIGGALTLGLGVARWAVEVHA